MNLSTVSSGEINASVAGIATKMQIALTLMKSSKAFNSSKTGGESDEATTCINGKWIKYIAYDNLENGCQIGCDRKVLTGPPRLRAHAKIM